MLICSYLDVQVLSITTCAACRQVPLQSGRFLEIIPIRGYPVSSLFFEICLHVDTWVNKDSLQGRF
ncbi:hypothetical protein BDQ17DRAFT_1373202 [Cyathus striatus]|nr:hypothetical protein BDQ17DRAFT_1373202 [Cyathus striatus]